MNDRPNETRPEKASRGHDRNLRRRNWALMLALLAFVVIVYIVAMVRMRGG